MIEKDLRERPSGAIRDSEDGKVNYLNCFDNPMWDRFAVHMTKAEATKGKRNWMKAGDDPATAEDDLRRGYESLARHTRQFIRGDTDEDHAAAMIFNLGWIALVEQKIAAREQTS